MKIYDVRLTITTTYVVCVKAENERIEEIE